MDHVCTNCRALLGVGNVFCVNCGTPVTASIEIEHETVIRPAASPSAKPKASATSAAVGILILAVGGIFMLFYGLDGKRPLDNSTNAAAANAAARTIIDAQPADTPSVVNRPMSKPEAQPATPQRITAPTATPRVYTPESANSNQVGSRSNRAANIPDRSLANLAGYAPYDRNGKRLRAICKDGSPSYWQYDSWAICLAKGGPRIVFW